MVWGSLISDLPMVVFHAAEKLLRGQSEQYIWETAYFLPHWTQFGIEIILVGSYR
jgi:hypothetical protein